MEIIGGHKPKQRGFKTETGEFDRLRDLQYPRRGDRSMPKKSRKTRKKKASPTHDRSSPAKPKRRVEAEDAAAYEPAAAQKFESDLLIRGEAGHLKNGKLPLGQTHIIENRKGAAPKLTRARFSYTG